MGKLFPAGVNKFQVRTRTYGFFEEAVTLFTHLVEECEVALAAAGLVAELCHADRLAVGLLDGEAQDVSAMKRA